MSENSETGRSANSKCQQNHMISRRSYYNQTRNQMSYQRTENLERSQGRVPGVLEPPFWVMKMIIISRGKTYGNSPLEIPRDEIFVFEEKQKKINLKMHRMLYRRLQYFKGA